MKKNILIGVVFIIIILITLGVFITRDSLIADKEWGDDIKLLYKNGCRNIQIDVDGNTCHISKTIYSLKLNGCTEMLTTKFLETPICFD